MTDTERRAALRMLQVRSRPLDPDQRERGRLLAVVEGHLEHFLSTVEMEAAYRPDRESAAVLERAGIPGGPRPAEETLRLLAEAVEHSGVSVTSPRYLGYIPSGGVFHSAVAGLLAGVVNRYSGLRVVSPGAANLEDVTVRWLADVLGYPSVAGGVLTSGGSMATTTAVAAARDHAGVLASDPAAAVVYVTVETHLSLARALHLCGLGSLVRRVVPVDGRRRMRPDLLAELVTADREAGLRPWMVAGTAGSVNTGAVDPLLELAEVCEREGLWFHVDGAYGGLFRLCPEGQDVLRGMERADSVVVDPHKTLFLPYGTGAVLVRDGRRLVESFASDAAYLGRDGDPGLASPADLSVELTRPFRALALWLPLQLVGTDVFVAALSEKVLLARHVYERLSADPLFEVGAPPDLSIVAYRARPTAGDLDAFNAQLVRRIQCDGTTFVTSTRVDGRVFLRAAVGSFRTHLDDVDRAVDAILAQAHALAGE